VVVVVVQVRHFLLSMKCDQILLLQPETHIVQTKSNFKAKITDFLYLEHWWHQNGDALNSDTALTVAVATMLAQMRTVRRWLVTLTSLAMLSSRAPTSDVIGNASCWNASATIETIRGRFVLFSPSTSGWFLQPRFVMSRLLLVKSVYQNTNC